MARYIDADKFIDALNYNTQNTWGKGLGTSWWSHSVKLKDNIVECINNQPTADVVEIPKGGIGELSDGYHTFNELYHHRAILFSVICNSMPDKAWKSKLHDTGDMFEGMFIVGIETPDGQATYHYDINPYWDMFKVKELEKAPKWDGHTPTDAINRIANITAERAEVKHGEWEGLECNLCGHFATYANDYNYCPNCGAKMDKGEIHNGKA